MSRAAIRYAKAILEFANEANKAEAVNNDMKSIVKAIEESSELKEFLSNPIVKQDIKKSALLEVFASVEPETKKMFDLLLENKRFEILKSIASEYNNLFDTNNGVQLATVTTAFAITPVPKLINKRPIMPNNKYLVFKDIFFNVLCPGGFLGIFGVICL